MPDTGGGLKRPSEAGEVREGVPGGDLFNGLPEEDGGGFTSSPEAGGGWEGLPETGTVKLSTAGAGFDKSPDTGVKGGAFCGAAGGLGGARDARGASDELPGGGEFFGTELGLERLPPTGLSVALCDPASWTKAEPSNAPFKTKKETRNSQTKEDPPTCPEPDLSPSFSAIRTRSLPPATAASRTPTAAEISRKPARNPKYHLLSIPASRRLLLIKP